MPDMFWPYFSIVHASNSRPHMQGRQDQTSIERKQEAVQNFAAASGDGVRMSREEVTSLVNTIIKVCSNLNLDFTLRIQYMHVRPFVSCIADKEYYLRINSP